jgi:hypothetical protein
VARALLTVGAVEIADGAAQLGGYSGLLVEI